MSKYTFDAGVDEERIQTLQLYLKKKDTTIEEKLVESLDKLYQATVPQQVREFLDERQGMTPPKAVPKQTKKKPASTAMAEPSVVETKTEEGGLAIGSERHQYPHSNT